MACYYPTTAYYSRLKNPSGKRSLVFNRRDAWKPDDPLDIPCGKCEGCRSDQALAWSIRAYHEFTLHPRSCFVTLTYSDDRLPPDGKIQKKDLQDFFKRMRRDGHRLRYIACGEYGEQTRRPHYHAIIFGLDFLHDKIEITSELYTSPTLLERWSHGHVSIAPCSIATIMYVCGYVQKKIGDPDTFSLASRRPPIGHKWLEQYSDDIRRTGHVIIEGKKFVVPKRYLQWREEEFAALIKERRKNAQSQDYLRKMSAVRSRELNAQSKRSQKSEKI